MDSGFIPSLMEMPPAINKPEIGWPSPDDSEYDNLPWPDPGIKPVQYDDKSLNCFSKIVGKVVFFILLIAFAFIFAKALFPAPIEVDNKFPSGMPDPRSLPADCRYVGLTVEY